MILWVDPVKCRAPASLVFYRVDHARFNRVKLKYYGLFKPAFKQKGIF